MSNLIKIHNVETNEIIEREMTAEELSALEKSNEAYAKEKNELIEQKLAKKVLLEKLGITEDEAKLLLG